MRGWVISCLLLAAVRAHADCPRRSDVGDRLFHR
jgi:hypothetical protein